MNRQQGFAVSALIAVIMTVGFFAAAAFGIWAFIGMQANETDLDSKIAAASAVAVKKAEDAKDVEFAEKEKSPFKTYTGSATYGTLSFNYPKTWSVYLDERDSGTVLDFYAHPDVVPAISNKGNNYALRAQILSDDYATEAKKIETLASAGKISAVAYNATNVEGVLGLKVTGEISTGKQGVMIVLPQRDKTIKIWTESAEFASDFENVINSVSFIP